MWKPGLAALALLIGSLYGAYFLSTVELNSLSFGFVIVWTASCVISGLGILAGLGGVIASAAIEENCEGYFKERDGWRGQLAPHTHPGEDFFKISMLTGISLFILGFSLAGFSSLLFVVWLALTEFPMTTVAVLSLSVLVLCLSVLAVREDIAGTITRATLGIFFSCSLGLYITFLPVDWTAWLGQAIRIATELWQIPIFVAGIFGGIIMVRFFKNTKAYQSICPKRN